MFGREVDVARGWVSQVWSRYQQGNPSIITECVVSYELNHAIYRKESVKM